MGVLLQKKFKYKKGEQSSQILRCKGPINNERIFQCFFGHWLKELDKELMSWECWQHTVATHPGAMQLTRPLGAIFTISFLSDKVNPYIIADVAC